MDLHHLLLAGLPALRKCFLLVPQQQASRPQPCAHRSSCSFDHPSGLFVLKKLKILRMNQGHRSASSSRQRIDHPHPESLTTRLIPVEVDLKQQIFDVCSSLNNGHSPKGRLRQLCADIVAKSFCEVGLKFCDPQVQRLNQDVGDHVAKRQTHRRFW